jgi:hypothetical protein
VRRLRRKHHHLHDRETRLLLMLHSPLPPPHQLSPLRHDAALRARHHRARGTNNSPISELLSMIVMTVPTMPMKCFLRRKRRSPGQKVALPPTPRPLPAGVDTPPSHQFLLKVGMATALTEEEEEEEEEETDAGRGQGQGRRRHHHRWSEREKLV